MNMLESMAAIMTVLTIGLFAYTIYHEKRKRRWRMPWCLNRVLGNSVFGPCPWTHAAFWTNCRANAAPPRLRADHWSRSS